MRQRFLLACAILAMASASSHVLAAFDPLPGTLQVGPGVGQMVVADFNEDGHLDLAALALPESGPSIAVLIGHGTGQFDPPFYVAVGWWDEALASGDLDADGHVDLLVCNQVYRGDGTGGFTEAPPILGDLRTDCRGEVTADANLDGYPDIARTIYDEWGMQFELLLSDGTGGFTMDWGETIASHMAGGVATGDLNGDGRPDFAAAASAFGLYFYHPPYPPGAEAGFNYPGSYHTGDSIYSDVAVGDFNRDGYLDVVATETYEYEITLMLNVGGANAGMFGYGTDTPVGGMEPWGIAAADFNGDGALDVVTANYYSDNLSLLFGDGAGSFGSARLLSAGAHPTDIVSADFNEDGWPDLAATNKFGGTVTVYLSMINTPAGQDVSVSIVPTTGGTPVAFGFDEVTRNGFTTVRTSTDGPLSPAGTKSAGFPPTYYTLAIEAGYTTATICLPYEGALVGDESALTVMEWTPGSGWVGLPTSVDLQADVACMVTSTLGGSERLYAVFEPIRAPAAGGLLAAAPPYSVGSGVYAASTAIDDFNLDGRDDVIVVAGSDAVIFLGDGLGGLVTPPTPYPAGSGISLVATGDFNGDGAADAVLAGHGFVRFMPGTGTGSLGPATSFPGPSSPYALRVGYLDSNGTLDLAIAAWGGTVEVLLGDGAGGFSGPSSFDSGSGTSGLAIADLDGDGDKDLASSNWSSGDVRVLLGNGAGSFSDGGPYPVGPTADGLGSGDLDGDGDIDLAVANGEVNSLSVLLNNGNASFIRVPLSAEGTWPWYVEPSDINNDGNLDLVVIEDGYLSLFTGDGTGHFGVPAPYFLDDYPGSLSIGDLNGDRRPDLVVAGGSNVWTFLNISLNTPTGAGTSPVTPTDATAGGAPVEISFQTVTSTGFTTLATSPTGPPLPQGFQLGDPPTYYDIDTTATFSGGVTVCIHYAGVSYTDESALQLLHGLPGTPPWENITTSLDTEHDIICGVSQSLSPFVVAQVANRPPIAEAGSYAPVEATSPAGAAVSLDGSGSSDPDGNPLTYEWTGPFGSATGATPTVALPVGTHTVWLTVGDGNGASSTDTAQVVVRDSTPPVVTILSPLEGAIYTLNEAVTASFQCDDFVSGIAACTGSVPHGAWIDTAAVGPRAFSATATDGSGNTATASVTYRVAYAFTGFLQPVDNLPVVNVVNGGRTVPIKWRLADAAGAPVSSTASFVSLQSGQTSCDGSPTDTIPDSATTLSAESLRYDAAANQFVYDWRTDKSWSGTCRQVWLTLADGTVHAASFRFK